VDSNAGAVLFVLADLAFVAVAVAIDGLRFQRRFARSYQPGEVGHARHVTSSGGRARMRRGMSAPNAHVSAAFAHLS
jgi:hypothetical protein